MGTAKRQPVPRKSNIVKKKNEDHREEKIFLSKRGILKVIYFFSFQLCIADSFCWGSFSFSKRKLPRVLCALHAPACSSGRPGRTRARSGGLAGSLGPGREAGRSAGQALRPRLASPASGSPCTTHLGGPGCSILFLLRQRLPPSLAHSRPRLCPHASSCPGPRRQAQGMK